MAEIEISDEAWKQYEARKAHQDLLDAEATKLAELRKQEEQRQQEGQR
jgi:hypothetical protein